VAVRDKEDGDGDAAPYPCLTREPTLSAPPAIVPGQLGNMGEVR
jgi:hypothetical protein